MDTQEKRQIIIMGADNLGNQMLVYSIENELMLPCGIYPHPLHHFPDEGWFPYTIGTGDDDEHDWLQYNPII